MPPDNWVPLGKSRMIDYKSVFQKGHEIGVKWYILEMDKYAGDVYSAVDTSLVYIQEEKLMEQGAL
jgi:sugar phosphate isomerase/epimerase